MSSPFHAEGDEKVKWKIGIYPFGRDYEECQAKDRDEEDCFTVCVKLVALPPDSRQKRSRPTITGRCGITLYDEKNKKLLAEEVALGLENFTINYESDGFWKMCPQKDILNCESLSITITVEYGPSITSTTTPIPQTKLSLPMDNEHSTMKEDFEHLYTSKMSSDVSFIFEDQEIRAHKAILAARSAVFAAMFNEDTDWSLMKKVVITDVFPDIFDALLCFIYTDQIDISALTAVDVKDLLVAANRYLIPSLQYRCEKLLSDSLTVQSCTELLTFADLNKALRLKAATVNFIRLHQTKVKLTDGWKNLKRFRPELAVDVLGDHS